MTTLPDLCPHPDNKVMAIMWASCLHWSLMEKGCRALFEQETGYRWVAPKNGMERMIDEACGFGEEYVCAFIVWFNANIWGDPDEPEDSSAGPAQGALT